MMSHVLERYREDAESVAERFVVPCVVMTLDRKAGRFEGGHRFAALCFQLDQEI